MTNLLVEGGSDVLGSFLDAGAIDEVHVDVAPILIGGRQGKTAVGGIGVDRVADALRLAEWKVERAGEDYYLHGWIRNDGRNGE
jgi:diaminohydroxyphosphoribosylaminopyrimidine deaminase/5-amino-6-(5-phosphoribosylamino)uracil reductase